MSSLHTVELHRLAHVQVRIVLDPEPSDPREDDNLGTMVCWHRRYNLGDEHKYSEPEDFVTDIIGEATAERLERWYDREYNKLAAPLYAITEGDDRPAILKAIDEARAALTKTYHEKRWAAVEKAALVLPLYLYDHSGITISTGAFSCPWDSGRVGYVYMTRAKAREEYGLLTKQNIERALQCMRGEVATYDEFLTGQVYGFIVETLPDDEDIENEGDEAEGDHLDSCWGFYGGVEYCREEAMSSGRHENEKIAEEHAKAIAAERQEIVDRQAVDIG